MSSNALTSWHRLLLATKKQLGRWFRLPYRINGNDIVLASFPKSGSTWLRFILGNVSRIIGKHGPLLDFHSVARYAPGAARKGRLKQAIRTPGHPLVLATHSPYVRPFCRCRSLLLVRRPEEVMASYFHHLTDGQGYSFRNVSDILFHWRFGIPAWIYFYRTWLDRETVLVHYEDMLSSPIQTVCGAFKALGCNVSRDVVAEAVEESSRENMHRALAERGDPHSKSPSFQFVRPGPVGGCRSPLSEEARRIVAEQCRPILERLGYSIVPKGPEGRE